MAVAAIKVSRSERGEGTWKVAHFRATDVSAARIRPSNVASTCPSIQARRTAPCDRSRRSRSRMPISNSRIDIADRYKVDVETLFAQLFTLGSILLVPALRSSEMTLVSSRYIRRGLRDRETRHSGGEAQTRSRRPPASPAVQGCFLSCQ